MQSVEIRYAGVVVGQAREVRRRAGDDTGVFLVFSDPLPVGTAVELTLSAPTPARVVEVVESPDPEKAGMYLRLLVSGEEAVARGLPAAPGAPVTNGVHAGPPAPEQVAPSPPDESLTPLVEVITTSPPSAPASVTSPVPVVIEDVRPTTIVQVSPEVIAVTADQASAPEARATAAYGTIPDAGDAPRQDGDLPRAKPLPAPDGRRRTQKRRRK